METKEYEIIKGNSSDVFSIRVQGVTTLDDTWNCRLVVTTNYASEKNATKRVESVMAISTDAKSFVGVISPEESLNLDPNETNYLIFIIENLTQKFRKEMQYKLKVLRSGIF
jgi:hypothetical protein